MRKLILRVFAKNKSTSRLSHRPSKPVYCRLTDFMLDSSSLLSDGDFDVVSKLSSAALARADIKAFAKSKHNAMFLFLSIRLQYVFLTSIFQLVAFVPHQFGSVEF